MPPTTHLTISVAGGTIDIRSDIDDGAGNPKAHPGGRVEWTADEVSVGKWVVFFKQNPLNGDTDTPFAGDKRVFEGFGNDVDKGQVPASAPEKDYWFSVYCEEAGSGDPLFEDPIIVIRNEDLVPTPILVAQAARTVAEDAARLAEKAAELADLALTLVPRSEGGGGG